MSQLSISPAEYRRRVELGFKACEWQDANPYRARLLERLGGLHRAPRVADERTIQRTEPAVEVARDIVEAQSTEGCPF